MRHCGHPSRAPQRVSSHYQIFCQCLLFDLDSSISQTDTNGFAASRQETFPAKTSRPDNTTILSATPQTTFAQKPPAPFPPCSAPLVPLRPASRTTRRLMASSIALLWGPRPFYSTERHCLFLKSSGDTVFY